MLCQLISKQHSNLIATDLKRTCIYLISFQVSCLVLMVPALGLGTPANEDDVRHSLFVRHSFLALGLFTPAIEEDIRHGLSIVVHSTHVEISFRINARREWSNTANCSKDEGGKFDKCRNHDAEIIAFSYWLYGSMI